MLNLFNVHWYTIAAQSSDYFIIFQAPRQQGKFNQIYCWEGGGEADNTEWQIIAPHILISSRIKEITRTDFRKNLNQPSSSVDGVDSYQWQCDVLVFQFQMLRMLRMGWAEYTWARPAEGKCEKCTFYNCNSNKKKILIRENACECELKNDILVLSELENW